jgi:hypothetical protein
MMSVVISGGISGSLRGGLGGRGWMYIDYIDGKASGPVGAFPRLDSPKN